MSYSGWGFKPKQIKRNYTFGFEVDAEDAAPMEMDASSYTIEVLNAGKKPHEPPLKDLGSSTNDYSHLAKKSKKKVKVKEEKALPVQEAIAVDTLDAAAILEYELDELLATNGEAIRQSPYWRMVVLDRKEIIRRIMLACVQSAIVNSLAYVDEYPAFHELAWTVCLPWSEDPAFEEAVTDIQEKVYSYVYDSLAEIIHEYGVYRLFHTDGENMFCIAYAGDYRIFEWERMFAKNKSLKEPWKDWNGRTDTILSTLCEAVTGNNIS